MLGMNIAGMGKPGRDHETRVPEKGVGMKTGFGGMASVCLALVFTCFSTIGALAQPVPDTTPPEGRFDAGWPRTHDGITPFTMAITFTEPVVFEAKDIRFNRPNDCNTCPPAVNIDFARDYSPVVSNLMVDPNNDMRWTFTVTPTTHTDGISTDFTVTVDMNAFEDLAGNANRYGIDQAIIIRYMAPPPNVAPEADAGADATVNSGQMYELDGTGSTDRDSDDSTLKYAWTRAAGTAGGTAAAVTLTDEDTATPTFTAAAVDDGSLNDKTYIFTLTVTDARGGTDTDTVTITINSDPIAMPGDPKTVPSGGLAILDGSGSLDGGGGTLMYSWTRTGGTGASDVALTGAATSMLNVRPTDTVADAAGSVTHIFTLTVTDEHGATNTSMPVTVTVEEPIAPPVAEIDGNNPEMVKSGGMVAITGRATADRRRTIESYSWTRADGTTTGLTNANTAMVSFMAETLDPGVDDVQHVLTLTVTDNEDDTAAAMVTVTVQAGPLANAGGNQNIVSGTLMFTLDGSGSRVSSPRTLTYAWTQLTAHPDCTSTSTSPISGVTLNGDTTAMPTFRPDTLGDQPGDVQEAKHLFQLTVTVLDSNGNPTGETATDIACLTLVPPNDPPVVNAGDPQTVDPGELVFLTGASATDADGNDTIAGYAWTRTDGTAGHSVSVINWTSLGMAQFIAEPRTLAPGAADVEHIFTLTVTDDRGTTGTDTVKVTVVAPFAAPVANAGEDQTVRIGTAVTLDGTGSKVDRRFPMGEYAWERTGGTGDENNVTLDDPTAESPMFTPMLTGTGDKTHIFTLTVTDEEGATDTDMVTVTVTPNMAPVAVATIAGGVSEFAPEAQVTLYGGRSSDPDGTIATYAWERTGGTDGATAPLAGADTATPTFTARIMQPGVDVTHIFTLTVTDNDGATNTNTNTNTVTVTIIAPNQNPVANAGSPLSVVSGGTVMLDGSGSDDPDPDDRTETLTYSWTRTGGSGDMNNVTLTNEDTATPTVMAATLTGTDDETHIFTLTVTDDEGASDTDTVTVTIIAFSVDIVLEPSEVAVQEGGSGTYRVKLSEAPRREVTITATSGNEGVVRLKNTRLVFNMNNWDDWQEVEIDAVADSVKKDDRIRVPITHSIAGVASNRLAAVTVTVRAQEDDPIMAPVGQFIATRATALLGQQPDLTRFLKQDGPTAGDGGAFNFQATDGRLSLDGGFIHNGTWGEVTGARTDSESSDTESVLASFGIHRKYSETFLAGAMLQFDLADRDLSQQAGTIDGTGWLVGPYFVARHGSQPLYFEGRLLYGQSDNDIRFIDPYLGVRTGSFDSARLLAQIRVEGEIAVPGHGDGDGDDGGADGGPRLIPYADIRWVEDRAAAFTTVSATTGVRTPVPGQTVNISQLELGSNMEIPVAVRTGSMILTGGLGVIWSNTEGDHIRSDARGRGRGEFGFSYDLDDNLQIGFDSFYDGIGASGYESYGLSLTAQMKF